MAGIMDYLESDVQSKPPVDPKKASVPLLVTRVRAITTKDGQKLILSAVMGAYNGDDSPVLTLPVERGPKTKYSQADDGRISAHPGKIAIPPGTTIEAFFRSEWGTVVSMNGLLVIGNGIKATFKASQGKESEYKTAFPGITLNISAFHPQRILPDMSQAQGLFPWLADIQLYGTRVSEDELYQLRGAIYWRAKNELMGYIPESVPASAVCTHRTVPNNDALKTKTVFESNDKNGIMMQTLMFVPREGARDNVAAILIKCYHGTLGPAFGITNEADGRVRSGWSANIFPFIMDAVNMMFVLVGNNKATGSLTNISPDSEPTPKRIKLHGEPIFHVANVDVIFHDGVDAMQKLGFPVMRLALEQLSTGTYQSENETNLLNSSMALRGMACITCAPGEFRSKVFPTFRDGFSSNTTFKMLMKGLNEPAIVEGVSALCAPAHAAFSAFAALFDYDDELTDAERKLMGNTNCACGSLQMLEMLLMNVLTLPEGSRVRAVCQEFLFWIDNYPGDKIVAACDKRTVAGLTLTMPDGSPLEIPQELRTQLASGAKDTNEFPMFFATRPKPTNVAEAAELLTRYKGAPGSVNHDV